MNFWTHNKAITRCNRVLLALVLCSWAATHEIAVAADFSVYHSRSEFMAACRSLPGFRQSLKFENTYCFPFSAENELKISGVRFMGNLRERGYVGLLDSAALVIIFPKGAKAFGADFSSFTSQYRASFMGSITADSKTVSFPAVTHPRYVFFGVIATGGFTNIVYDDGGGIGRTNFNGQAVLANPLMVLDHVPPPVLTIVNYPQGQPGFTWSATNPGFALQQSPDLTASQWATVSPRSTGCSDSWFLPTTQSKLMFYRLVFVPAF